MPKTKIANHLSAVREQIAAMKLDGFVIPHTDEWQNEYLPACSERLAWLTGFTGSAGLAIVLPEKAGLFVDGRYTLQAPHETDKKLFSLGSLWPAKWPAWLKKYMPEGAKIGCDSRLFPPARLKVLQKAVEEAGGTLVPVEQNPVDRVWHHRPAPPHTALALYPASAAGQAVPARLKQIAGTIKKAKAAALLITDPTLVAWAFNIRANDVSHVPVALAEALVLADGRALLSIAPRKKPKGLQKHLGPKVAFVEPDEFRRALAGLKNKAILVDPNEAAQSWFDRLNKLGAKVVEKQNPCLTFRAAKHVAEREGMKEAQLHEGITLARLLCWIDKTLPSPALHESDVAAKLELLRLQDPAYRGQSFESIVGFGPNGAVIHYDPAKGRDAVLDGETLLLLDVGGHYTAGTTDTTRTVLVGGHPTKEMKEIYTRVLKGHIALATATFRARTPSHWLDRLARAPLKEIGLNYAHGTGHGVGNYLSVHEGPGSISLRPSKVRFHAGMVFSNEPGCYLENKFGVRLENLVMVQRADEAGHLNFETITLAPFDLRLVDAALLDETETGWLNAYHARVQEMLVPHLDRETATWLKNATRPIKK